MDTREDFHPSPRHYDDTHIRRSLTGLDISDCVCAAGDQFVMAYRTGNPTLLGEMLLACVEANIRERAAYPDFEINPDAEADAAAEVLDAYMGVLLLKSKNEFRKELAA